MNKNQKYISSQFKCNQSSCDPLVVSVWCSAGVLQMQCYSIVLGKLNESSRKGMLIWENE